MASRAGWYRLATCKLSEVNPAFQPFDFARLNDQRSSSRRTEVISPWCFAIAEPSVRHAEKESSF